MDSSYLSEQAGLSALKPALKARSDSIRAVRHFFEQHDFLEVVTPVRVKTPALELHIDAACAESEYLRTSPELHMKRLLAAGYDRVFQIGPCFRKDEKGSLHHPEFTMLEWYRAHASYLDILADTKEFVVAAARAALGRSSFVFNNSKVELDCEWEVITVSSAFSRFAGWDPVVNYDPDRFDLDLVEKIEPVMSLERPVVLIDFPAEAAALARLKPDDIRVAERWELYIGRVEIANAFGELVDPVEQRRRFEECAAKRAALNKPVYKIDEEFMSAMDHGMPPSAGAALGVDRLIMLFINGSSLDSVLPFR